MILGVDPGAASTGLVLRDGDDLLWHGTVTGDTPHVGGWDLVLDRLAIADIGHGARPPLYAVAIEMVVAPTYYAGKKMLDPRHAITTAIVAGAVAGWAWSDSVPVVWVPPGHNGQGALDAYPVDLRPTRGQGKGADSLRHCRSAWDVAGLGALLLASEVTV